MSDGSARHICHISTAHQPFDTRVFRRECRSLARDGYLVSYVAPHDREVTVDGVRIIPLPAPRRGLLRRLIWPFLAARVAARSHADLYHFHDPELIPAMQLLHLATGRPVVWDAHEVYTNVMVEYNQFGWKPLSRIGARFFGWYERWASRHSFAGVVTITDAMAERYRDLGKPVAAVGNFAEDEALAATPAAGARRGDPPLIVTTGLLSADRGVYLMLQALELLRPRLPCRLALWGAFDSVAEQTQFLATAERLGLGDLVHVSGPYPRNTLLTELLPTASVACVLYLQRQDYNRLTIPNRLTEYWACRLPVITTDDTFAGRMTSATGGGLLTDNSPADLAAQLERLLRDPAAARAMGERGREGVLSTYNWDAAFKELRTLYTRILGPLST